MNKDFLVGLCSVIGVGALGLGVMFAGLYLFGGMFLAFLFACLMLSLPIALHYDDISKLGSKVRKEWKNR